MNKIFSSLLVAVGVLLSGFVGCSTTGDAPRTPQEQELRAKRISIVIKNTVFDLIVYGNQKDPETTSKAVDIALGTLNGLLATGTEDSLEPGKIREALVNAGFDKVNSPEALLAFGTLVTTYELYWAEYTAGKVGEFENVRPLAEALRDGLAAGKDAITVAP